MKNRDLNQVSKAIQELNADKKYMTKGMFAYDTFKAEQDLERELPLVLKAGFAEAGFSDEEKDLYIKIMSGNSPKDLDEEMKKVIEEKHLKFEDYMNGEFQGTIHQIDFANFPEQLPNGIQTKLFLITKFDGANELSNS